MHLQLSFTLRRRLVVNVHADLGVLVGPDAHADPGVHGGLGQHVHPDAQVNLGVHVSPGFKKHVEANAHVYVVVAPTTVLYNCYISPPGIL